MNPILTTITPYWNRPGMLEVWLEAIRGSSVEGVEHILLCVGDEVSMIVEGPLRLRIVHFVKEDPFSIGHCHNMGARLANSEWIMKIDVDTLPNIMFFRKLKILLAQAGPREWFNCGMIYFKQNFSKALLTKDRMPMGEAFHSMVCENFKLYSSQGYHLPAATNFICRTQDYLDLGGCDPRFNGYGWEDYQQIYMLERYEQGKDPLPGRLDGANVTRRCRDEISRRKAAEMFYRDEIYCLFHKWHLPAPKDPTTVANNRGVLLDWIEKSRAIS